MGKREQDQSVAVEKLEFGLFKNSVLFMIRTASESTSSSATTTSSSTTWIKRSRKRKENGDEISIRFPTTIDKRFRLSNDSLQYVPYMDISSTSLGISCFASRKIPTSSLADLEFSGVKKV